MCSRRRASTSSDNPNADVALQRGLLIFQVLREVITNIVVLWDTTSCIVYNVYNKRRDVLSILIGHYFSVNRIIKDFFSNFI
jgi:hypothetical protein